MSRTAILILIATERVSGPLKGIFQYLHHVDRDRYHPVLGLLQARRSGPSDAELEARRQQLPYTVIEQSGTFDWRLFGRVRRLALEHRAALVQTHGYKTHLLGLFVKRSIGVRWVGFEHGWTAETWRVRLYHRLDWLLRYADRIVAVSEHQQALLRRMGVPESRLLRIHNAVEVSQEAAGCPPGSFRQAHGIPLDAPLVTVIGRISREKGQRIFLDAFCRLRTIVPHAHAVIVGEGVDADDVRHHAAAVGLGGTAQVVEWQRPITPVYVDSDVVAIPSLSEGISNVLLEAMAAGRPVVATRVGGTPEVVAHEQHALLVPPGNAAAMAEAIARLLQDKPLRDRLVEEALRRVEAEHSPAHRAKRIAAIYDSLAHA